MGKGGRAPRQDFEGFLLTFELKGDGKGGGASRCGTEGLLFRF